MAEQRGIVRREGIDSPFQSLQRAMNQLFDEFMGRPMDFMNTMGRPMGSLFSGMMGMSYVPRIDIGEDKEAIYVTAEVPGMDAKDIQVSMHEDVLTIEGEKRREWDEKRVDPYTVERSYGRFRRQIQLPMPIDADKIDARYERGLLTLKAPKLNGGRGARRIEIKGK